MPRQREERSQHDDPQVATGGRDKTAADRTRSVLVQRHFTDKILLTKQCTHKEEAAIVRVVADIHCDEAMQITCKIEIYSAV